MLRIHRPSNHFQKLARGEIQTFVSVLSDGGSYESVPRYMWRAHPCLPGGPFGTLKVFATSRIHQGSSILANSMLVSVVKDCRRKDESSKIVARSLGSYGKHFSIASTSLASAKLLDRYSGSMYAVSPFLTRA